MSHRNDQVTLREMLDHTVEALNLVADHGRADLDSQRVLYLALLQLCQIIGEAASRVSEQIRDGNPDVPWREIIALRNRLIHGYDTVDRDILWQIIDDDFPPLRDQLTTILQDMTPQI